MSRPQIVRAIDVGYGNTKFVAYTDAIEGVQCSLFPSIAPQAGSTPDLAGTVLQRRNTVIVKVDGVSYEVGRDARLAQDASYGRVLDPSYSMTSTYLALVRGALFYMGAREIDVLVLGLPVNTIGQYAEKLQERVVGTHVIPGPGGSKEVEVTVHKVRVVAQPIGGFFDFALRTGQYGRMKDQMNLLVDPGFYTLDWVVAQGAKMVNARSGAHSGGMSAILQAIAEPIGKKLGTQITDTTLIDKGISNAEVPKFFGKPFPLDDYIPYGKEKARQFVSVLANRVGSAMDIDNIVLVGGGARFFKDVLQEKFPNHDISISDEPVFANVRGFQMAGEQAARQMGARSTQEA